MTLSKQLSGRDRIVRRALAFAASISAECEKLGLTAKKKRRKMKPRKKKAVAKAEAKKTASKTKGVKTHFKKSRAQEDDDE